MSDFTEIMSFDLKKFRIRIHKSTIHAIGDPRYIHLLVSPDKRTVGVRGLFGQAPDKDAHRVKQHLMESENSYEIYSRSFLQELCEVVGGLEEKCSYRIMGKIIKAQNLAVYSLDTVTKIEG